MHRRLKPRKRHRLGRYCGYLTVWLLKTFCFFWKAVNKGHICVYQNLYILSFFHKYIIFCISKGHLELFWIALFTLRMYSVQRFFCIISSMTVGGDITALKIELIQKHQSVVVKRIMSSDVTLMDYFACIRVISVYYLEPTSLNILKIIPPSLKSNFIRSTHTVTFKIMTAASQETSFWQRYNWGVSVLPL